MSKELRQMMDEEREAGWKEGKKEGRNDFDFSWNGQRWHPYYN